jgi:hypothetical protein
MERQVEVHFNDSILTAVFAFQFGGMAWAVRLLFVIDQRLSKVETIMELYLQRKTERMT